MIILELHLKLNTKKKKKKRKYGESLKILTPKQMIQRLPIAIAQVRASNTSQKFTK